MTSEYGVPGDAIMVGMDRLQASESAQTVEWLKQTGQTSGFVTGFDPDGWPAHAWLLHAMYQNQALAGLGTHHDARRLAIDRGAVEPLIVGDVDLDASSTVTGVPLGYVVRPDDPWKRLRWREYLDQTGDPLESLHDVPPSTHWFPHGSWPVSIWPEIVDDGDRGDGCGPGVRCVTQLVLTGAQPEKRLGAFDEFTVE